jgi:hypothetical protein
MLAALRVGNVLHTEKPAAPRREAAGPVAEA